MMNEKRELIFGDIAKEIIKDIRDEDYSAINFVDAVFKDFERAYHKTEEYINIKQGQGIAETLTNFIILSSFKTIGSIAELALEYGKIGSVEEFKTLKMAKEQYEAAGFLKEMES